MSLKKWFSIVLAVCTVGAFTAGCGGNTSSSSGGGSSAGGDSSKESSSAAAVKPGESLPRNETLYIDGLQWGAPTSFNPLNSNPASLPIAMGSAAGDATREITYETLYMYNELDGKMYPLLGKSYSWNSDQTVLTVKMNPDAHWNDGQKVTAKDVVYTLQLAKKYTLSYSQYWDYLSDASASDDETLVLTAKATNKNPLMLLEALDSIYVLPEHVWSEVEKKYNNKQADIQNAPNDDPVASGPYKLFYKDDTKIELIRDENYWGKAESMWGKLPTPKYIVHNIYKDNASGDAAFKQGQVDVSQQFSAQIWTFGSAIKTYLPNAPYYVPGNIPFIIFNTTKAGLDNADIRRAIATAVDYDAIGQNAMSGYTAKISPSLMLPTDPEQKLIDSSALKQYQWGSNDAAAANKLLDSIGAKKGSDGIRVYNGKKLSFKVECPSGWTDWNATCSYFAQAGKAIGLDISTYFPQAATWTTDMQTGTFDMVMNSYQGPGISSPWMRAYQALDSVGVAAVGTNAYRNYGRYKNAEVDKLLDSIPTITDEAKLKEAWTKLNTQYLKDCPLIGAMYRPAVFYSVNTSVWKGFPVSGDGTNIPPQICIDGYGIAALYKITSSK